MQVFNSRVSKVNWAITLIYALVILLLAISLLSTKWLGVYSWLIVPVFLLFTTWVYSLHLQKIIYHNENYLELKRLFSSYRIPLNEIISIGVFKGDVPMTYSSKGLFGNNGKAMDGTICMINDANKMLLVKMAKQKVLFSCDDSEGIISALKNQSEKKHHVYENK